MTGAAEATADERLITYIRRNPGISRRKLVVKFGAVWRSPDETERLLQLQLQRLRRAGKLICQAPSSGWFTTQS